MTRELNENDWNDVKQMISNRQYGLREDRRKGKDSKDVSEAKVGTESREPVDPASIESRKEIEVSMCVPPSQFDDLIASDGFKELFD